MQGMKSEERKDEKIRIKKTKRNTNLLICQIFFEIKTLVWRLVINSTYTVYNINCIALA